MKTRRAGEPTHHYTLKQDAIDAIERVYSDETVDWKTTVESLVEIQDDITQLIQQIQQNKL